MIETTTFPREPSLLDHYARLTNALRLEGDVELSKNGHSVTISAAFLASLVPVRFGMVNALAREIQQPVRGCPIMPIELAIDLATAACELAQQLLPSVILDTELAILGSAPRGAEDVDPFDGGA